MPEPIAEIVLRDEVSEALRDWEKKLKDLAAPRETAKATGEFNQLRDSVGKANREFGTLLKLTGAGAIIGAGFVATVASIGKAIADFSRSRLSVHYLAQEVGVATTAFERLVAAGQGVGLTRQQSIADVSGFLGTLQELRARGPWSDVAQNLNWFGQAGFKLWSDLHRISRGPGGIGDAAEELFERMQTMRPEAQAAIMRMFNMSSVGWRDVDLTLIMRAATPSAQAMRDYLRALVYLDVAMGNVKITVANAVMPIFERLAIRLAEWLESPAGKQFLAWLEDVARAIERVDWDSFRVGMVTFFDAVKGVVADIAAQLGLMDPQVEKIGGWAPVIEGALVGGFAGWLVGVTSPLASLAAVGAALAGFAFLRGATTAPTMLGVLSTPSIKNQRGQTVGRATAGTNNASYSATRIKTQRGSDVSETSSERPYTADIGVGHATVSRTRQSTVPNGTVDARVGRDGRNRRVGMIGSLEDPIFLGRDFETLPIVGNVKGQGKDTLGSAPARFVVQQFVETNRALSLAVLDVVHELARINDVVDATGFTVGEFGSGVNAIRSVLAGQGVPARGYRGGGGAAGEGGLQPEGGAGAMSKASVRAMLEKEVADAGLVGYVPPDGAAYGIRSGSSAEWVHFFTELVGKESGYNPRAVNRADPGGSHGLLQLSPLDVRRYGLKGPGGTEGELYDPRINLRVGVGVAAQLIRGSGGIRRGMGQYWAPIRSGWTPGQGVGGAATEAVAFLQSRGGHFVGRNAPAMDPEFASRLAAAAMAYERETGQRANIGEMGRDVATQAQYYRNFLAGRGGRAAPPGRSQHNVGRATDVPRGGFLNYLIRNGRRFGVRSGFIRDDPVHTEPDPNYRGPSFHQPVGSLSASLARERSFVQRARQARLRARIRAPRNVDVRVDGDGAFAGNVAVERQVTSTLEPAEAEG